MKEFKAFEIITQRPDGNLTVENATCPFCDSEKYKANGTITTLLGVDSMNHKWHERTCKDCGNDYTVEEKNGNVWITDKDKNVKQGIPSCFEDYVYDCKCGGKVRREYTKIDGSEAKSLSLTFEKGKVVRHYRTFYKCDSCHAKIETERDYY